jgi:hypothetical protein
MVEAETIVYGRALFRLRKAGCHAHASWACAWTPGKNAAWPNKFGHGTLILRFRNRNYFGCMVEAVAIVYGKA